MKLIRGSGGGGGKGGGGEARVPQEAPDSLQSKAFVKVIDLVGEGEIEGVVDGFKSIYLDGTPLQNPNGTFNFRGVEVDFRTGTQDQEYIPGFGTTENELAVGVEVKKATPIVRTFTNPELDAVSVRISLPQLTEQDPKTGDLKGFEVRYAIQLQSNGGGYNTVWSETIIGKCTSKYERQYRVDLEGDAPWDVRVVRQSDDENSVLKQNKTYWESYTEIVDGKLRYPNSAVVAMKVDASQFSQVPVRSYDVKLLRVQVPNNYNPETRQYSGTWDGTFVIAWTDNPAWIFYDLITNERYGLGGFISESQVDKWSLYEIAQYCDELVPDGFGGTEPRFTCNCYFQEQAEAYQVIQDLASVFRGMVYWLNGAITAVQDSPADPAFLFTNANVVDGSFAYSGSSAKSRHTVALVTWNDPDDGYKQKIEYVEDADAIARYGVIEAQVVAFGCTSRGQANRVGKWLLFTEQYQTETVAFKTGLNGAICRPGQVIKVADKLRAGSRRAGRIKSATTTEIETDQTLSIDPSTHTLSVVLPDGSVEERSIQSTSGATITVTPAFSVAPNKASIWMVASAAVEPQLFKIVAISEGDTPGIHNILAVAHNESKYDSIELGLTLEVRSISSLSTIPESPTGLVISETLYSTGSDVRVKVNVAWNPVPGAIGYVVTYNRDSLNPITLNETSSNEIEILNAEPGTYYVSVYARNSTGARSVPTTGQQTVVGKVLPPGNVLGFSLLPLAGVAYISWERAIDLDVLIGGFVRVRHTPLTVGASWKNAVDVVPALPGTATRIQVPLMPGTYMAKFVDSSGSSSNEEAIIATTIPAPQALNVIETITEHPAWAGTKSGIEYSPSLGGIALAAAYPIDDYIDDVDTIVNWDFAGGVTSSGEYNFAGSVDLGSVFSSRITANIKALAVDVADLIDLREDLVDDWLDLDGDFIDDVNAEIYMRSTEDDPAGTPTWTDWKRFFVGEYLARAFEFKLAITSDSTNHNLVIQELEVAVDMPDRTEAIANLTSGTGAYYQVDYAAPFHETPSVGITGYNLNSGDYWQISNNTRSGFRITFRNSGGTIVSRNFDVIAKGYGREI